MYRDFEHSKPAGFPLVAILLTLIGMNAAVVFGGKDVSLSEVPRAARDTIEHEAKGLKIDDIEQDKDDGQVVYEVDAENDDRQIKLKVAQDGSLLEREEEIDSDDLPNVVLAAVKKSVGDIDFDDIEKRFRRGRNTYYKIEGETDEFKVDLEVAEDGTILDKDIDRKDDDLPGDFRDVRRTFLQLRGQLKVVTLGDSRVEKGVDPKYFLGEENQKHPIAFSFGSCAKGVAMVQLLCEDYFVHGPKMEWVVYGLSSRVFNTYYRSGDNEDNVKRSRVYREDKARWATLGVSSELVPFSEVDTDGDSPWGFDGEDGVDDDLEDEDDREDAVDDLRGGRYKFDVKRLEMFESMIQALAKHNIRLLAFTPLIHPVSIGQPCTDDDGTPREAYDEFVARMNALDKKYPNFHFLDVNKKGEHGFEHECFNNLDHLNIRGAKRLSLMLNDFMMAVDSGKKNIGKEQPQQ
ncbi:MAG: PepSY domain-containing protein [Planctomycetota bacterium]